MIAAHPDLWQLQEAKSRLSALIDAVEAGREQIISRHGKPVARVIPFVGELPAKKNFLEVFRDTRVQGFSMPERSEVVPPAIALGEDA